MKQNKVLSLNNTSVFFYYAYIDEDPFDIDLQFNSENSQQFYKNP